MSVKTSVLLLLSKWGWMSGARQWPAFGQRTNNVPFTPLACIFVFAHTQHTMAADTTTQPVTAADVLGDNVALLSAEVRGVWGVGGGGGTVSSFACRGHNTTPPPPSNRTSRAPSARHD